MKNNKFLKMLKTIVSLSNRASSVPELSYNRGIKLVRVRFSWNRAVKTFPQKTFYSVFIAFFPKHLNTKKKKIIFLNFVAIFSRIFSCRFCCSVFSKLWSPSTKHFETQLSTETNKPRTVRFKKQKTEQTKRFPNKSTEYNTYTYIT